MAMDSLDDLRSPPTLLAHTGGERAAWLSAWTCAIKITERSTTNEKNRLFLERPVFFLTAVLFSACLCFFLPGTELIMNLDWVLTS